MSEQSDTVTPYARVKGRKQGKRLTKQERKLAQEIFLQTFADTANVRYSCESAGIERTTFYRWLEQDEEFAFAYNLKTPDANDALVGEAWRRGVKGVDEPVVSAGQLVYRCEPAVDENGHQVFDQKGKPIMKKAEPLTVKKYSDTLLLALMRARMPEYRDKQPDISINNVNLNMQRNEVYASMHDDELDQLEALWNNAQERLQRGSN